MKPGVRKLTFVLFAAVLMLSLIQLTIVPSASATYLRSWSALPLISDGGPDGKTGQDITGAWWWRTGGNNYFRIDLLGTPVSGSNNFSQYYGIYIDSTTGGGSALGVSGIDYILRVGSINSTNVGGTWPSASLLSWDGLAFVPTSTVVTFQHSENGGKTLEWQFANSNLNGIYTFFAATTGHNNNTLVDRTNSYVTPVPNAAWLLGSGIIGLIGLQRRRTRKA